MPAAELSACHSGPSREFFGALAPSTDMRANGSSECARDGRLREAKKPGNDVPGFFVTSDGASSGADNNRDRRSRREAHSRNGPAGNNQGGSRSLVHNNRTDRTRWPQRRRRVRRRPCRKPVPDRCPAPQPALVRSRRWRQPWQPSPKLLAFFSCASPHSEHRRNKRRRFSMVAGNRVPAVEIGRLFSPLICAQGREPLLPRGLVLLPEIFADDFAVRLSPTWPLEQLPQLRLEPCANRRQFSHHH